MDPQTEDALVYEAREQTRIQRQVRGMAIVWTVYLTAVFLLAVVQVAM